MTYIRRYKLRKRAPVAEICRELLSTRPRSWRQQLIDADSALGEKILDLLPLEWLMNASNMAYNFIIKSALIFVNLLRASDNRV